MKSSVSPTRSKFPEICGLSPRQVIPPNQSKDYSIAPLIVKITAPWGIRHFTLLAYRLQTSDKIAKYRTQFEGSKSPPATLPRAFLTFRSKGTTSERSLHTQADKSLALIYPFYLGDLALHKSQKLISRRNPHQPQNIIPPGGN